MTKKPLGFFNPMTSRSAIRVFIIITTTTPLLSSLSVLPPPPPTQAYTEIKERRCKRRWSEMQTQVAGADLSRNSSKSPEQTQVGAAEGRRSRPKSEEQRSEKGDGGYICIFVLKRSNLFKKSGSLTFAKSRFLHNQKALLKSAFVFAKQFF